MKTVNEISLEKFFTYTNSVYDIFPKFKGLERKNLNSKTKPETVAKSMFASMILNNYISLMNMFHKCMDLETV